MAPSKLFYPTFFALCLTITSGTSFAQSLGDRSMAEKKSEAATEEQQLTGRSVFVVNTTPAGISVQTAFVTDDQKLINMPAVFPDVEYAFQQIDELKRLVAKHFSDAARVGAEVISAEADKQKEEVTKQ